ncbi:hypothetical protein Scep_019948 [Stephania cephalantha]|uniref:Uncharacterized protein n=1 Tax=Stephania cephalantha TaxID=152367 RepID=A0AAP0IBM8_9MAGN
MEDVATIPNLNSLVEGSILPPHNNPDPPSLVTSHSSTTKKLVPPKPTIKITIIYPIPRPKGINFTFPNNTA